MQRKEKISNNPLSTGFDRNGLDDNDLQLLIFLACGRTLNEYSQTTSLSEHTLNLILQNICRKLNARNSCHAIAIAMRDNIIAGCEVV